MASRHLFFCKRFQSVHGNQPFSDPLEYISIDPELFHMLFPGDYELMLHIWCNWRYVKPQNKQDGCKNNYFFSL